jgi:dihydroflavonol-4-reductase
MMREGGQADLSLLEFVPAELNKDAGWEEAVAGCDYVLHVASPIGHETPKDENEMIRPAVDGTLRVLKAARDGGVKRVVVTSNFGAVGFSHTDTSKIITEENWTNPKEKHLSAYNKSKVLAEQAAWDFMKREGGQLELAVINPTAIFGPALSANGSGNYLLKTLLNGSMKSVPNITLGIADVRDVADLHIRAMANPKAAGERFLALSGVITSLPEIAQLLKNKLGPAAEKVSIKRLPDWLVKLAALFSPQAREAVPLLSRYREASNEKARKLLGWKPRSNQETLLDAANSLIKFGDIKV